MRQQCDEHERHFFKSNLSHFLLCKVPQYLLPSKIQTLQTDFYICSVHKFLKTWKTLISSFLTSYFEFKKKSQYWLFSKKSKPNVSGINIINIFNILCNPLVCELKFTYCSWQLFSSHRSKPQDSHKLCRSCLMQCTSTSAHCCHNYRFFEYRPASKYNFHLNIDKSN